MQHEYNDMLNHLYMFCSDYDYSTDTAPKERVKCSGWICTDFDTIHECPWHYTKECDVNHPDYEPHYSEEIEAQPIVQNHPNEDDCPF